jgi:AcrR family transcriptional regulator
VSTPATVAPLIGRALTGSLSVSDHETDQRIIDAVLDELLVTPLRKLSLEDVARRAGLTRVTVYRRFGDRQRVIEAMFAREISRFLEMVAAADDPAASASDRVAEAFATALRFVHSHRVVTHLLATGPGELLDTLLADDRFVIVAGSAYITAQIQAGDPESPAGDAHRIGELLGRLFVALVLMPPTTVNLTDPDQARALARELIAPIVIHGTHH